jgi:hypothetical protein
MAKKPKDQFLQIRLTAEDRQRIERVAAAAHLDASTWARQVLLQTADIAEGRRARVRINNT